jgi:hypothetical protein
VFAHDQGVSYTHHNLNFERVRNSLSYLLHILCNLQSETGVTDRLKALNVIRRSVLVNAGPDTCVIYFSKLVDVIMRVLQHREIILFGVHRIVDNPEIIIVTYLLTEFL